MNVRIEPRALFDAIRRASPPWIARRLYHLLVLRNRWRFGGLSTKQMFAKVYEEGGWGRPLDATQKFYSGSGSHDPAIVDPYVATVVRFLEGLPGKPDVVDLGCGDFAVGLKIRPACGSYIAGDIVDSVIEFNRQAFAHLGVDFRVIDLATDELPSADVVMIRQVLQHLPNERILAALPKIARSFRFLVLTEQLPDTEAFPHNIDNRPPGIRLDVGSGVVITSPPFSLEVLHERCLCEVRGGGSVIRTMAYRLK
jgi:hypothetical protein